MLILTRKVGDSVTIGDGIRVKVISIESGQVRLGFEAPNDIPIYRDELLENVKKQNEAASMQMDNSMVAKMVERFSQPRQDTQA